MNDSVLKRQGVLINPQEQTVEFEGKEIVFTTREFNILYLLMAHCGQVLSKEQIYNQVVDFSERDSYHTIEISISRIKKKLYDGTEKKDLITNRYGSGYKFMK